MIVPSIGRVVWFYAHKGQKDNGDQPSAALVVFVHNERLVNLATFDKYGGICGWQGVTLVQEGDETPEASAFCMWMPYQIGQAKRNNFPPQGA